MLEGYRVDVYGVYVAPGLFLSRWLVTISPLAVPEALARAVGACLWCGPRHRLFGASPRTGAEMMPTCSLSERRINVLSTLSLSARSSCSRLANLSSRRILQYRDP